MAEVEPDFILGPPIETLEDETWRHNWLYSVLPLRGLYLSGYCRNCQKAFTVKIPHNQENASVVVTQLDIPRWGCVNPQESL